MQNNKDITQPLIQKSQGVPSLTFDDFMSQMKSSTNFEGKLLTPTSEPDYGEKTIKGLVLTHKNDILFSSSADTLIKIWNVNSGKEEGVLKKHEKQVNCLKVTNDDKFLFSGSVDMKLI